MELDYQVFLQSIEIISDYKGHMKSTVSIISKSYLKWLSRKFKKLNDRLKGDSFGTISPGA